MLSLPRCPTGAVRAIRPSRASPGRHEGAVDQCGRYPAVPRDKLRCSSTCGLSQRHGRRARPRPRSTLAPPRPRALSRPARSPEALTPLISPQPVLPRAPARHSRSDCRCRQCYRAGVIAVVQRPAPRLAGACGTSKSLPGPGGLLTHDNPVTAAHRTPERRHTGRRKRAAACHWKLARPPLD
jgi:hypothetical protein